MALSRSQKFPAQVGNLPYPKYAYWMDGLQPLEAMACGAPVIASRIAAHVETLGAHAHLVEPTDKHALAKVIATLLENQNERNRLSRSGIEDAARFSSEERRN